MKEIKQSTPFSSGTEYGFFLDNFCYRCKKHKVNADGFCEYTEKGGCPIENAMEDARFDLDEFPKDKVVQIVENGKITHFNICTEFTCDDADLMQSYKKIFETGDAK